MLHQKKSQLSNYPDLLQQLWILVTQSKKHLVQQVNHTIIKTYRTIGHYIVEYEQDGQDYAQYGSWLLQRISSDLTDQFGKGFSYRNIRNMRQIYLTFPIWQTVSAKSLSRSHYLFLSQIKQEPERNFYLIESTQQQRSLRELKRQFNSGLYQRLALSTNKKDLHKLAEQWQLTQTPKDIIKDPYILEFLWLEEQEKYTESQLEQAIIDNIEHFLLELGKGFTFVARQKRFTADEKHFYIDLVFYHRFLQCFVLIDLKIGELTHQDLWQMQMYVNRYDREIKAEHENKTIGLVLCKVKNDIVLKYTLPDNEQIFAKEYQLYLPHKEELEKYLNDHRE